MRLAGWPSAVVKCPPAYTVSPVPARSRRRGRSSRPSAVQRRRPARDPVGGAAPAWVKLPPRTGGRRRRARARRRCRSGPARGASARPTTCRRAPMRAPTGRARPQERGRKEPGCESEVREPVRAARRGIGRHGGVRGRGLRAGPASCGRGCAKRWAETTARAAAAQFPAPDRRRAPSTAVRRGRRVHARGRACRSDGAPRGRGSGARRDVPTRGVRSGAVRGVREPGGAPPRPLLGDALAVDVALGAGGQPVASPALVDDALGEVVGGVRRTPRGSGFSSWSTNSGRLARTAAPRRRPQSPRATMRRNSNSPCGRARTIGSCRSSCRSSGRASSAPGADPLPRGVREPRPRLPPAHRLRAQGTRRLTARTRRRQRQARRRAVVVRRGRLAPDPAGRADARRRVARRAAPLIPRPRGAPSDRQARPRA